MTVFIGTYTETMPHVRGVAGGILVGDYDDGAITALRTVPARNPSWLVVSPTHVYAVAEAGGGDEGQVCVFARAEKSLEHVQTVPSGGREPAHLALDPSGRFLVVANYADGVLVVLALSGNGLVERAAHRVQLEGRSAHPVRQSGPHPHQALFDPISGDLLVTDLGTDAVVRYGFGSDGSLAELARIRVAPGSGPRHAAFHPDGEHLLVLNELASTIAVFRREGAEFVAESLVSTLPPDAGAVSFASALAITADGERVYASNREHASIAVFAWTGSALSPLQYEPTRGRMPRGFTLASDQRFLLVGNQDSDTVVTFARDASGLLVYAGITDAPTPVCVVVA